MLSSGSGVYPFEASKAGIKIAPSRFFCDPSKEITTSKHFATLKDQVSAEMKGQAVLDYFDSISPLTDAASNPIPEFSSVPIASAFEVLTVPNQLKE